MLKYWCQINTSEYVLTSKHIFKVIQPCFNQTKKRSKFSGWGSFFRYQVRPSLLSPPGALRGARASAHVPAAASQASRSEMPLLISELRNTNLGESTGFQFEREFDISAIIPCLLGLSELFWEELHNQKKTVSDSSHIKFKWVLCVFHITFLISCIIYCNSLYFRKYSPNTFSSV